MTKKIVIDPGHGGHDTGAVGYGLQEKTINLEIGLYLRSILANYAQVGMTRNSDVFISLSDRAAFANNIGADLFVSIHANAGGGTGFESYVYNNATAQSRGLGDTIHREVANFYQQAGFPDRGLKTANFAVLREAKMPSTLLENLFVDGQKDSAKLKDPNFLKSAAGAIANGIIKSLNLQSISAQPPIQPGPTPQPTPQPTSPPMPLPDWATENFDRLLKAGVVFEEHELNTPITWGEFSAVIARLMDKLKI